MVAAKFRRGSQRSKVRARARLRISLAPPIIRCENPWQVLPLLHLAAKLHQHRREQVATEGDHRGRGGCVVLLVEYVLTKRRPAGPTPLDGPRGRKPSLGVQLLLPGDDFAGRHAAVLAHASRDVRVEAVAQKCADLVAERLIFGGEIQKHGVSCERLLQSLPDRSALRAGRGGPGRQISGRVLAALFCRRRYTEHGPGVQRVHVLPRTASAAASRRKTAG